MKKLFVAWQSPDTRKWNVVGVLEYIGNTYRYSYTKSSAQLKMFERFGAMQNDITESEELFPFFKNRLLGKARPEYKKMLKWMNMNENDHSPLDVLALTEGKRGTDTIEIFACPEPSNGKFVVRFFTHGVRHTHVANKEAVSLVKEGAHLYLMKDFQNTCDPMAIALRTDDPICFFGYLPRYLTADVHQLCNTLSSSEITVKALKVNSEAPLSYRFLCEIQAAWPDGFEPCAAKEYDPLSK